MSETKFTDEYIAERDHECDWAIALDWPGNKYARAEKDALREIRRLRKQDEIKRALTGEPVIDLPVVTTAGDLPAVCAHGQLGQSCELCEKDQRIAALERELEEVSTENENRNDAMCGLIEEIKTLRGELEEARISHTVKCPYCEKCFRPPNTEVK